MEKLSELRNQFTELKSSGYCIIFVDETMFTYNTLIDREYSNQGQNIIVQEKALAGQTLASIGAVSLDKGLEHFDIYEKSVNKDKFLGFLTQLQKKNKQQKIAIFLDNLRVHHNHEVKQFCRDKKIEMIFNLAYSPEFNPIEEVFSLLKNQYKRLKINSIVTEQTYSPKDLIQQSYMNINNQSIINICKGGHYKLFNNIEKTTIKNDAIHDDQLQTVTVTSDISKETKIV